MINSIDFYNEFPSAVTVCDAKGIIIYMNKVAVKSFEKWGGKNLLGQSLYDCHNANSCTIIKKILETGQENTYSIEKNGIKTLIHQSPWYSDGIIGGIIEMSIVIPKNMPHFKR